MKKSKQTNERTLSVTVTLPRELADACLATAEDPHEFRWGSFFRSLARAHLAARSKPSRLERLEAFANK